MSSLEEARKLAEAARTRYKEIGKSEDLEQMVIHFGDALSFCPSGHSDRDNALNSLGGALGDRYKQLGSIQDLDDAIANLHEALSFRPHDHPSRSETLNILGVILKNRFQKSGRIVDLEDAIAHHRESLSLCPPGHPSRSESLTNLGVDLKNRFEQSGRIVDLEEAIDHHHQSLSLRPPGHPSRSESLNNFAIALHGRYNELGRTADLEDAITHHHESLSLRPLGHPNRSMSLTNLGYALHDRYRQLGRIVDLEDAITHYRESLNLCPPSHPLRSISLNNLGHALADRYRQLGRIVDLEEAITHHYESLSLHPPGHPLRFGSLINIANDLLDRYEQLGSIMDLEDTITYLRESLSLSPPGHPARAVSLTDLALSLLDRYNQLGRIMDLEDAINYHRESLSLRPPGHPFRSVSLNNIGAALCDRYKQLGRTADLEDAITHHSESLSLRPHGHPLRSSSLNHLGYALYKRYKQLGRIIDLEDAITHHCESLSLRPPGHPDRSMSLNNVAAALCDRYKQLGVLVDLEDAITYHREALNLCPPGHPLRSKCLSDLADTLLTRYDQIHSADDIQGFFTLIQQAVYDSAASLKIRLFAAQRWAAVARNHHDNSLCDAYSMIFQLLNRSLILHPSVDSQHKFLASIDISMASDAAAAAIDTQDLPKAIELLEQGRAILWSKMTAYRHPLDELWLADEELADQFANISAELERLSLSSESQQLGGDQSKIAEGRWRKMRDLSAKWDEVVELIRTKEGFRNFLQAVPFETLREAAAQGPLIIVNVSKHRSDAIIILIDGPPVFVPLPDVQPEGFASLASELDTAQTSPHITDPSKLIFPVLCKLWIDIVHPVVERLNQLGIPEKSRIWWCPTSELCGLPLHAAGPYRRGQKNLPDRYISSYTPTISALIRARSNSIRQSVVPKVLVIGQPDDLLPNLQKEIDIIRRRRHFVDVIVGEEARRDKVLSSLQQHSWAHLACHSYLGDSAQPFRAGFQLYGDDDLTLLDLTQARLPNAELAFLSACHSAAADPSTPNEAISLAAALQFCGFRSVVGTLWQMEDEVAPFISKAFYKHMFRNPGNKADFRDSAEALNIAIRTLRRLDAPLQFWIMFVHIGA